MAVVDVNLADAAPSAVKWELPSEYNQLRSPIPRGIASFVGTGAVVAKGAGDETDLKLTITFPGAGFRYLPKHCAIRFLSDDLTESYNSNAIGFYITTTITCAFNLTSPGQFQQNALLAGRLWVPAAGTNKPILAPGDTVVYNFADMTAGATSAGDLLWEIDFYQFTADQVDKWEIHTPIPVISHVSF